LAQLFAGAQSHWLSKEEQEEEEEEQVASRKMARRIE